MRWDAQRPVLSISEPKKTDFPTRRIGDSPTRRMFNDDISAYFPPQLFHSWFLPSRTKIKYEYKVQSSVTFPTILLYKGLLFLSATVANVWQNYRPMLYVRDTGLKHASELIEESYGSEVQYKRRQERA